MQLRLQLIAVLLLTIASCAELEAYDPLSADRDRGPTRTIEVTVSDSSRQREIPLLIYLPPGTAAAPVVMFSHGLGGSRHGNAYLGEHWSARGFVVVYIQHPGSDESVWRDAERSQRMRALRQAASVRNFLMRAKDIPAVIDALARWNKEGANPLNGRLDLGKVGMSGHSFGAITTQALSGQRFLRQGAQFTDKRIRAAIAMSPSAPRLGDPEMAFSGVAIPWMLMTGTKDVAPIGDIDLKSRLAVFPALAPGSKYEVLLQNAEHSAFNDRGLPGDREARNPNHHRIVLALSTAFWDATLRGDPAAKSWLDGEGPKSVLEPGDRWQHK